MATITLTWQDACGGGGHVRLGVRRDAGPVRSLALDLPDIHAAVSVEDVEATVRVLLRLAIAERGLAVVRTQLQTTGLVVTV